MDMILGDIRTFITDDLLNSYTRILTRGHCSIFKNNEIVNTLYRKLDTKGNQSYRDVYSTTKSCCFDEWAGHCGGGISAIFDMNNIKMYDVRIYADVEINRFRFVLSYEKSNWKRVFYKNGNELTSQTVLKDKSVEVVEYLYVHFQKRQLLIDESLNIDEYMVVAPNIATSIKIRWFQKNYFWKLKGRIRRIAVNAKNMATKIIVCNKLSNKR